MTNPILAWHFLPESRMLRDGSMKVEAGYTHTYHGKPVLCKQGLHASVRAIDALKYAPGPIVCRVECGGTVVHDNDKIVCTERTVLWMADATTTLHEFACDVTEQALKRAAVDDARCWAAIEAKRRWLAGEITDAELAKTRAAVASAAYAASAAAYAASSAAWDAAGAEAWDAAWNAARGAAWDAARDVVWDAASATARDADWDAAATAAWNAARAAAWDAHNDMLTARLEALGES